MLLLKREFDVARLVLGGTANSMVVPCYRFTFTVPS
jgi:hypothetical protein